MTNRTTTAYTVKPFGALAALIDCRTLEAALHLHGHLQKHPAQGQRELVPAAQTVLVRFEHPSHTAAFCAKPNLPQASGDVRTHGRTVTIPVVYHGQDLADVAAHLDISEQAVIYAHTTGRWSVAFAGFAPGFFYLHRHDNLLDVPRRSSPRTSVPAGAVGLAGDFSGIYPRSSPGGWQLIGHTDAPLWDLGQNPPALLEPGMQVQFKAVRELVSAGHSKQGQDASAAPGASDSGFSAAGHQGKVTQQPGIPALQVVAPGIVSTFQDSGRKGLTHWGVSPSGAADQAAAAEANRLVGNAKDSAVIECLAGGLTLKAITDLELAVTGAQVPLTISPADDSASPKAAESPLLASGYTPFALLAGQTLTLGAPTRGLRSYLALRGGFSIEPQAQSRSRDTLAALGPAPLASGDTLYRASTPTAVVAAPSPALPLPDPEHTLDIRALPGPRENWFTPDSLDRLENTTWEVSQASDRIGVRLLPVTPNQHTTSTLGTQPESSVLTRANSRELPSEGMVSGAMQVPPNGEPVIFLADHPVTGGYPVIATVHPADLRLLAQAPPGTRLRFTLTQLAELTAVPSTESEISHA